MELFFATFSHNTCLRHNYVTIEAETWADAHEMMVDVYEDHWAFLYNEEDFKEQAARYGLREVPFGTMPKRYNQLEQMELAAKRWIEQASYEALLHKIRHEPTTSPWFLGETGDFLMEKLTEKRKKLNYDQAYEISKRVGWPK